jgi:hypothetical protein
MVVELLLDNSKSVTGKHVLRTLIVNVSSGPAIDSRVDSFQSHPCKPLYKKGECRVVKLPNGKYVYVRLLRNLRGHVSGEFWVIVNGEVKLKLKYRKLKLKRVEGDPSHWDLVNKVISSYKIPLKKVNLN